jgi:hypothetical protein
MMSRKELRSLLEDGAALKISIYLPTARKDVETLQGPIRLKNLIRAAEVQMEELGASDDEIKHLLKPLRALASHYDFWQHQWEGLALFRSHGLFREFRTPVPMPELAIVGPRYHIKPLFSWIAADAEFYILALSLNSVRVFRATRDCIAPLALPEGMPEKLDRPEARPGLQAHTSGPGQPGYHGAIVHGAAGAEQDKELEKFLRAVAHGMAGMAKAAPAPVVLISAESVAHAFRSFYRGGSLLAEGVNGSPEGMAPPRLLEKALPAVERHFARERQAAASSIEDRLHSRQASTEIQQILIAAEEGRVAILFVPVEERLMGTFDGAAVSLAGGHGSGEDLYDLAATKAYVSGADVYAVPADAVPGKGEIAAQFRY